MDNEAIAIQQTVYANGDDFFNALLIDIAQAKQKIDLEIYIFENDSLGKAVATQLADAARRGVKVRVLVDGAGTPGWGGELTNILENAGSKTQIFHPFPWHVLQWGRIYLRVPALHKALYLLTNLNARNHRKVCLIDDRIAYMGSFNISKVHLSHEMGGAGWRDTGVKLQGIDLKPLQDAFEMAWNHTPIQEKISAFFRHINKDPIIRLNNTRHRRRILYKNLLKRIDRCQQRIWMTNAYFVPDNFLLHKLREAAQRGVDVRIVLPHKSDVFFMPWATASFYRSLLAAGVRIYEYLPSMLHTKFLILDDWTLIGSSNLNHRSLLHDLEVDINIVMPMAKKALEQQFIADTEHSQEIHLSDLSKRPLYQRIIGRILLYLKYWI